MSSQCFDVEEILPEERRKLEKKIAKELSRILLEAALARELATEDPKRIHTNTYGFEFLFPRAFFWRLGPVSLGLQRSPIWQD